MIVVNERQKKINKKVCKAFIVVDDDDDRARESETEIIPGHGHAIGAYTSSARESTNRARRATTHLWRRRAAGAAAARSSSSTLRRTRTHAPTTFVRSFVCGARSFVEHDSTVRLVANV